MKIHVTREYESEEEYRAAELSLTRDAGATITATEVVRAPAAPEAPVAPAEPEITADRDRDDMPWNPDYHSTPKSFTEDGMWRAKRGKADEAKAARAAFKAAGGVVVAPTMPVMPTAAMPVMPVTAPILPPPVPFERLVQKITGMMQRGKVDGASIATLYAKVGATSGAQFETNESLRAALFTELCQIEPEVA